jgi:hypothetical protein
MAVPSGSADRSTSSLRARRRRISWFEARRGRTSERTRIGAPRMLPDDPDAAIGAWPGDDVRQEGCQLRPQRRVDKIEIVPSCRLHAGLSPDIRPRQPDQPIIRRAMFHDRTERQEPYHCSRVEVGPERYVAELRQDVPIVPQHPNAVAETLPIGVRRRTESHQRTVTLNYKASKSQISRTLRRISAASPACSRQEL